jgi:AcrR family transcriptional regulator
MGVSPLTFLVKQAKESTAVVSKARTVSPLDLGEGRCKPVDIQIVRQQLEAILADGESCPLSLKKIAGRIGYPVPVLHFYFPQLCNAIAERYQKLLDVDRQRQALETALASDENPLPSVKGIARCLGCSAKILRYRFPEECHVIAERRRKIIDIEGLRLALEGVLGNQEVPFPTEKEIARRLGCGHSTLRMHFPTLCKEIAKKRRVMAKSTEQRGMRVVRPRRKLDIDSVRQRLEEIVRGHEIPPPTVIEVAHRLGCWDSTLRKHFPGLCHEIAKRNQKKHGYDSLQRSLEAVIKSDERPPSLKELAQSLDCSPSTLTMHFPDLCAQIVERHRGWGDANEQRRVLEAALTSEEASSLSVNEIARLLGCSSATLFKRFPELCEAITKRRWELYHTEDLRQVLEAALANDELPPTLEAIAKRLGCHTQSLKYYFPDLCAAIVRRRREPSAADSLHSLQQALEEVLGDDEDPVSLREVARRLGRSGGFLWYHFPQQCRAISARYAAYRKSRSQARISNMCDEVKRATFLIHSQGEYPSRRLLTQWFGKPGLLWRREFSRAWREALRELGYD